jgi:nicotinamidase-related amidase
MPTALAGVFQLRQAKVWERKARAADTAPLIPHGSPGFALVPELAPRPEEAMIDKITMSAFAGTPLDIVLRDCGVRAYLICGIALEVGIEPTVRHSADLGYIPVVVRDACGAGDAAAAERSLAALAFAGDALIADTDEVLAALPAA